MAVTIATSPANYSPSDNPLVFTFSSNQTAQANFSFTVETYFNAVLVSEDQVFPEVSTYAHFDCSNVVRNLVNAPTIGLSVYQNSGTDGEYSIKVIENYGTPAIPHANATSSTFTTFKARQSDIDFVDVPLLSTFGVNTFLTNYPRAQRIEHDLASPFQLNIITDGGASELFLNFFDANGGLIDNYSQTQSYMISQVNICSDTLAPLALTLTDLSYYTVQVEGSEMLTVYLATNECNAMNTLCWINEFGAYDSFVFKHNLTTTGNVSSQSYGKQFGVWNGTTFEFNTAKSGNIKVSTTTIKGGTIYTDWVTESQQHWLTEAYQSVTHIISDSSGVILNVSVTSTEFSFQQQRFEELLSEALTFTVNNTYKSISI